MHSIVHFRSKFNFVLLHDDRGVTMCMQIGIGRFFAVRGCNLHNYVGINFGPKRPVRINEVSIIGGVRYGRFHDACSNANSLPKLLIAMYTTSTTSHKREKHS